MPQLLSTALPGPRHAADGMPLCALCDFWTLLLSVRPSAPPFPQLIGRANFSYFRFGQDPVIREETIRPAEPYERGPKDLFMIHPGEVVYLQGFFDFPGRCQLLWAAAASSAALLLAAWAALSTRRDGSTLLVQRIGRMRFNQPALFADCHPQ